jgi:hypothetical protein
MEGLISDTQNSPLLAQPTMPADSGHGNGQPDERLIFPMSEAACIAFRAGNWHP